MVERSWGRGLGAVLLLLLLPGCLGPTVDLTPLSATVDDVTDAATYTWREPVAFKASGAPVDINALTGLPVGIEQMVPGVGAEPNMGITSSGAMFVTTFDVLQRSLDQGRTWEPVWELAPPGDGAIDDFLTTSDPMMWVDPDTDRVFVNHMHPGLQCTYMAWSDDEGETWTDRPLACGATPGIDHQKVMTAKPRLPVPTAGYPNVVYVCNNKRLNFVGLLGDFVPPQGMGTSCYMSRDGGLTYPVETEAYVNDQVCSNINGHPAAYPDGTVAMVLGSLGDECVRPFTIVLSEDDGTTWQVRQCAKDLGQVEIDADMTVTPDGTAYVLLRHTDQLSYLARSADKWETCDFWRVSPPDQTVNVFAGITSGDDGRIAMAYLGTRDAQGVGVTPSNVTAGSVWHLFVTTVFDAASDDPTFVTQQVSPEQDPVQVGCVWLEGGGGGLYGCRNLLDFIDMVRDPEGRYAIAITDGCTPRNGCTGSPEQSDFQSRDRQIAIVYQDRGLSLFADKGELASLGLAPPVPEPR